MVGRIRTVPGLRLLGAAILAGGFVLGAGSAGAYFPAGTTYTVNTNADDAGTTGCVSVCSLRDAVNAANGAGAGVINIKVPSGHYVLSNGALTVNNSSAIIQMFGTAASTTIIDGSGNSAGTAVFDLEGGTVSIAGFTITGGTKYYGGAIYDNTKSLSLVGDVLSGNNASATNVRSTGGALYVNPSSSAVTLNGDTFRGNFAYEGGAIYVEGYAVVGGTGDTFAGNFACFTVYNSAALPGAGNPCLDSGYGGAIYDNDGANVTISNSTFTGNQAGAPSKLSGYGGAVYVGASYAAHFANDTFSHNVAGSEGGAIANEDGAVSIVGGSMSYNLAGDTGGAIYQENVGLFSAGVNYTNNQAGGLFVCTGPDANNHVFCTSSTGATAPDTCPSTYYRCDYSGGTGGAFYINEPASVTGGLINSNTAVTLLQAGGEVDTSYEGEGGAAYINDNVVFTGVNIEFNRAYDGGGVYLTSYPETMHGGMMLANKAMDDGGAYYLSGTAHLIVDGATLVTNTAGNQTGGIWDGAIGEVAIVGAGVVTGNISPGMCKNVLNPCLG